MLYTMFLYTWEIRLGLPPKVSGSHSSKCVGGMVELSPDHSHRESPPVRPEAGSPARGGPANFPQCNTAGIEQK
jgi:hypothetical protein